jgi:hypothetical protein
MTGSPLRRFRPLLWPLVGGLILAGGLLSYLPDRKQPTAAGAGASGPSSLASATNGLFLAGDDLIERRIVETPEGAVTLAYDRIAKRVTIESTDLAPYVSISTTQLDASTISVVLTRDGEQYNITAAAGGTDLVVGQSSGDTPPTTAEGTAGTARTVGSNKPTARVVPPSGGVAPRPTPTGSAPGARQGTTKAAPPSLPEPDGGPSGGPPSNAPRANDPAPNTPGLIAPVPNAPVPNAPAPNTGPPTKPELNRPVPTENQPSATTVNQGPSSSVRPPPNSPPPTRPDDRPPTSPAERDRTSTTQRGNPSDTAPGQTKKTTTTSSATTSSTTSTSTTADARRDDD